MVSPDLGKQFVTRAKKVTNHVQVVNALGLEIVSGICKVGSVLPGDAELAERFHVSRTVLREAMKTLTAKGLVIPRARVGTRVTPREQWNLFDADILAWSLESGIDSQFLLNLSDMRLAFEPFAASLAAANASADQIEAIYEALENMNRADHSAESLARADLVFHLAILEASGNPFMRSLGSLIETALVGVFRISSTGAIVDGHIDEVVDTHRTIADAIASRDEDGARDAMRRVIFSGREHTLSRLSAITG